MIKNHIIKSIGSGAFYGCSNLDDISIPDDIALTIMGQRTFHGTKWHKEHPFLILNHTLYSADPESCIGNMVIPEGVNTIYNHVFSGCTSLTNVIIPGSVTTIGQGAFSGCTSLTNLTLSEGLTHIGYYAFYNTGLTSISIPLSVTTIEEQAIGFLWTNKMMTFPNLAS